MSMRFRSVIPLSTVAFLALTACEGGMQGEASLETEEQRASYAVGINVGSSLRDGGEFLDMPAFQKGLREAMAGDEYELDPAELQAALEHLNELMMEQREAQAQANLAEGQAFVAENGENEGVTTTESGLQYEVLEEGEGASPGPGDEVVINYRGTLIDGTEFDSSYERGEPATFRVGGVIPGFSEGLQLMRPGGSYRLVIPPELGYGPQGSGQAIGPNAVLIFEVEMIEVSAQEGEGEIG
jgi:FKBP-type peptidyl-prolyl cis-trans isomerase FkpA/FKBP-type peptidyl-prolyl cis-trans isomerase FklB